MSNRKDLNMNRIAVVSHNYNMLNRYGHQDFAEHFSQIHHICDTEGCDTILYSLFTWDERSPVSRNHDAFFGGLSNLKCIIVEVGNKSSVQKVVEIWVRNNERPHLAEQTFAKSSEPFECKREFIRDIHKRVIGNGLIVICGESNITNYSPDTGGYKDPFGFNDILRTLGVKIVFNPLHDYMTRYEMKKKRAYYSLQGRTVVTVWNQGKRKGEAPIPWTVFQDGKDLTGRVKEIRHNIASRPDIRIGIVPDIG